MLSNKHFYHRITRKMVVAFGTMFNNIRLVRYNKTGTAEIERITVPLSYAAKEKFYTRITQDPNLNQEVQITLPRMSFELDSITYDPLRKRTPYINEYSAESNTSLKSGYKTPYNFNFSLNIYVRNTEDGTQIIEQILPYFNPDYTLTANLVDVGPPLDIPIILQNVTYNVANDTGSAEDMRIINWTLTFTVQSYLFGPIGGDGANGKLIRKVIANTYADVAGIGTDKVLSLTNGTGNYKIGELVFTDRTIEDANVTAFVKAWDPVANNLVIEDINGVLTVNTNITGAVTNASYRIASYDNYENQVIMLTIEPNPLTANANDDFGFTETIYEYPNLP
jgi:hypothetical protein